MKADLVIKNGKIFSNGAFFYGDVVVKDGKIISLCKEANEIEFEDCIDAEGKLVLPGMIEPHIHIREPGRPDRGTFLTETMAAATGGVTTILEHPIAKPPQYSKEILENRIKDADDKCIIDFGFYGAAGSKYPEKIKEMGEQDIVAFKTFLHEAPEGRDKEFIGLTMANDGEMYFGFKEVAKTGKLCAVHAENNDIIHKMISYFRKEGKISPIYHCESRPKIAEYETVEKLLNFVRECGVKLIFCHISTPEAMELIKNAKQAVMNKNVSSKKINLIVTKDKNIDKIRINIIDNGIGMTEEQLSNVFDPFISFNENTPGLGLAIVHRIIKDHHGVIKFSSKVDEGTDVKITLNVYKEEI